MEAVETEPSKQIDRQEPTAGVVEVRNEKQDAIVAGVIGVGLIAGIVGIIVFSIKEEKKELERERQRRKDRDQRVQDRIDWINKEQEDGNAVYELKNGQFLVVDRQAKQKTAYL